MKQHLRQTNKSSVSAAAKTQPAQLHRATFRTNRLLDFFSEKELVAQIGHQVAEWPLVAVKELIDNALSNSVSNKFRVIK